MMGGRIRKEGVETISHDTHTRAMGEGTADSRKRSFRERERREGREREE
jgi:hypothetical protein